MKNDRNTRNRKLIAKYTACHAEYPIDWERMQNSGNSQLGSVDKCEKYWNAAERLMLKKLKDSVLQREFRKAHRIIVDETHCYRKDLFKDKGWCKITDEVPPIVPGKAARPSTKWGFCSTSCNVEYMMVCLLNRLQY